MTYIIDILHADDIIHTTLDLFHAISDNIYHIPHTLHYIYHMIYNMYAISFCHILELSYHIQMNEMKHWKIC